jgi:hypothetical protein
MGIKINIFRAALLLTAASGTSFGSGPPLTSIRVIPDKLLSEEAPVYQHLWNLAEGAQMEGGQPVVIVVETEQGLFRHAFIRQSEEPPGEFLDNRTDMTYVLNPRYSWFFFGESSLRELGYTDGAPLSVALDTLMRASNDAFTWQYDTEHGVINVIEKALAASPEWFLNAPIAGIPFSASGPIESLNSLLALSKGLHMDPDAPACQDLTAKTDAIEVRGGTVRAALNSILGTTSDVYRYYHIHPHPPMTEGAVLGDWLSRERHGWGIVWWPEGYGELLEGMRRYESRIDFTIPPPATRR